MAYCSPVGEKEYKRDKTCFSREALERLVEAWNEAHPGQRIPKREAGSKRAMWRALNARMAGMCKGSGREWCWVDNLHKAKATPEVARSIRPSTPREWYSRPYAWLSNFDIEAVMRQYQDDKENRFAFLGVYPMDFAAQDTFGSCLYKEICALDIGALARKGIKHVGMITNLDYHDQDGSHWTSLFACIDPRAPCFGAYYYDSTAPRNPPKEITAFMEVLKAQATAYAQSLGGEAAKAVFKTENSKVRHQYGNTECGVFSMAYQIRWLDRLKKNPATTFDEVVRMSIKDEDVHRLRGILFRPNTAEVVKGGRRKGSP